MSSRPAARAGGLRPRRASSGRPSRSRSRTAPSRCSRKEATRDDRDADHGGAGEDPGAEGLQPAQVRDTDGDALTLAVAENVIRADLNPIEEARAYARLVTEHGDAAKVAKLVGRSEKLIGDRLELLRLPDEARPLLAARKVPLACAPVLIR